VRFSLPCDDGNNINDDGCSSLCQIESGYTCSGGSPNSRDVCTQYLPPQLALNLTGTSHLYGTIIVNLKLNYLPANLTNPITPCTALCEQILNISISAGYNSYTAITVQYFPGTFSFAIEVQFGIEPIPKFTIQATINQNIAGAYFPGINASGVFSFPINPAFLSIFDSVPDLLA
jgi:hypothetical protein